MEQKRFEINFPFKDYHEMLGMITLIAKNK